MRDLLKTTSFAALHFGVGFGVTYALTGSVAVATGVALVEPAVNTVVFYFHERAWSRVPRGDALHGEPKKYGSHATFGLGREPGPVPA